MCESLERLVEGQHKIQDLRRWICSLNNGRWELTRITSFLRRRQCRATARNFEEAQCNIHGAAEYAQASKRLGEKVPYQLLNKAVMFVILSLPLAELPWARISNYEREEALQKIRWRRAAVHLIAISVWAQSDIRTMSQGWNRAISTMVSGIYFVCGSSAAGSPVTHR